MINERIGDFTLKTFANQNFRVKSLDLTYLEIKITIPTASKYSYSIPTNDLFVVNKINYSMILPSIDQLISRNNQ